MVDSLWGDEFNIPDKKETKEKTKKILNKISKPKEVKVAPEKIIKNKTISLEEKLKVIEKNVLDILSKQATNVEVITNKDKFNEYLDKCISIGKVAVDTETNNSLDPITCKLMGLCLYCPGQKQVYIPVNHRNSSTKERFEDQLTEKDIKEGLEKLIANKTFIIMHNGKFDYQVLKCTCGVEMPINWDTMIAFKLIDENEFSVGLKQLYIKYIDPEQEKYSIDHLFDGVEYADVCAAIFALYAATDSLMTYRLYEYELPILTQPDYKRVYELYQNVELPCIIVTAEMELAGVEIDQEYAVRLQNKYHKKLEDLDVEIVKVLSDIQKLADMWRETPEAKQSQMKKQTLKQYERSLNGSNFDESLWTYKDGNWYKISKCKADQLDQTLTPESLASPTQLGIILYDILKCPIVNKEKPYATGEEELKKLLKYSPICDLMLKRRELVKLISTYIDTIPELAKRWPDGRVRTHFNQYGAATGRFSSSDPINLQNIPSHNKELRMLFKASDKYNFIESYNNSYEVTYYEDVLVKDKGWTNIKNVKQGDLIELENNNYYAVKKIEQDKNYFKIYV